MLAIVALSACDPEGEVMPPSVPRTLTLPTNVTRIDVLAPDAHVLKQIDAPTDIARVLSFLAMHRAGWKASHMGFPTPPVELFFHRGDQRLGRFGAGLYRSDCRDTSPGYFQSDLALDGQLPLHGIGASETDLKAFLTLVGLPDDSLETNDC
jgi:hypothetical protein